MKATKWILSPLFLLLCASFVNGQATGTTSPDDPWAGAFGAGLSVTGGNTSTKSFNLSLNAVHDPKTKNVIKFNGLYLRASQKSEKTADRLRLGARDEWTVSDRTFLFGVMNYQRDPFKEIDYLINPLAGVGYKLFNSDKVLLSLGGGAGMSWEKNPGVDVNTSGTVNGSQEVEFHLSEGTLIYQNLSGLWKMEEFQDSIYHFSVGVETQLTDQIRLKVEFADDYVNLPPSPDVLKNDTVFLTTFLYSF